MQWSYLYRGHVRVDDDSVDPLLLEGLDGLNTITAMKVCAGLCMVVSCVNFLYLTKYDRHCSPIHRVLPYPLIAPLSTDSSPTQHLSSAIVELPGLADVQPPGAQDQHLEQHCLYTPITYASVRAPFLILLLILPPPSPFFLLPSPPLWPVVTLPGF